MSTVRTAGTYRGDRISRTAPAVLAVKLVRGARIVPS